MTAADEYRRVLAEHRLVMEFGAARCFCRRADLTQDEAVLYDDHRAHVAQALAADPGVRAAVEREARAEAWDEGHRYCELKHLAHGKCVNPYRQEPSDG